MQDLRVIPINKVFSEFYNEYVYHIPCKVLEFQGIIRGRTYGVKLQVLDFYTGEIKTDYGITFKGTIELYEGLKIKLPKVNMCVVRKLGKGRFQLVVYNIDNIGLVEKLYGVEGILNEDKNEYMEIFNHNYKELRAWLNESLDLKEQDDSLPF